jgi:hypothetical protein
VFGPEFALAITRKANETKEKAIGIEHKASEAMSHKLRISCISKLKKIFYTHIQVFTHIDKVPEL